MKPVNEWDENYLIQLPPGEHDWIEFKGVGSLDLNLSGVDGNKVLNELSKQISAFANSGGGTIVYGIKDAPPGQDRIIDNGGISLNLKGRSTKEWLEDVIPNLVDFPLEKFNIYVILKSESKSEIEENKGIFLVSIPDSEKVPHQATDNKYYARVGGKSRPITHRMVMDIIGRFKHPKMALRFTFIEEKEKLKLSIFCKNVGKVYAKYVNGFLYVPISIISGEIEKRKVISNKEHKEIYFSNLHEDLINYKTGLPGVKMGSYISPGIPGRGYYVTRYDPVLPKLGFHLNVELEISKNNFEKFKESTIIWYIHADNSPQENGSIHIGEIPIKK